MTLNIYDPDYLLRVHRLQMKRNNIIRLIAKLGSWSNDDVKSFADNLIGPVKNVVMEKRADFLQKCLSGLFDKGIPLVKRLYNLSEELSVPALHCLEFLFWLRPSSYPPPTNEMSSLIGSDDLISFVANARKVLRKSMLKDFIELQAALMKSDESDIDWFVNQINSITLQDCSKIEPYRQLYFDLNTFERAEVRSKLRCHAYIQAALTRKAERGMVLDGNNIFMLRKKLSDLEFVLEKIAQSDGFYYPFWIVFDKNIVHLVDKKDENWLESPSVFLYSPADELILQLAMEKNAVVVSSDRFRQWDTMVQRIDPRRFFE